MKWIILIVGVLIAGAAFLLFLHKESRFDWRANQSPIAIQFLEDCPEGQIRWVAVSPRSGFFVSDSIDLKQSVISEYRDGAVSHMGEPWPTTPQSVAKIESLRRALPEAIKAGPGRYDFEDNLYLAFRDNSSLKIYEYPLRPLSHALHDFLVASYPGADQEFSMGL